MGAAGGQPPSRKTLRGWGRGQPLSTASGTPTGTRRLLPRTPREELAVRGVQVHVASTGV